MQRMVKSGRRFDRSLSKHTSTDAEVMFPCTVGQLQKILGGSGSIGEGALLKVTGVSIDSRTVRPGDVFFAMSGQKTHGMQFAAQAKAAGAACIVSNAALSGDVGTEPDHVGGGSAEGHCPVLLVSEPIAALQALARWNRRQSRAMVIGITGSVGKTTTRQMLHHVLTSELRGIQSPKNFNNELGVPLSMLELGAGDEVAVLEMGATRRGDIQFLCELASPGIGVVTRVSPCHLQSFGDLQAIRDTKQELVCSIPAQGMVFLNGDDELVRTMSQSASAPVVFFGTGAEIPRRFQSEECSAGKCSFRLGRDRYWFEGGRHLMHSAAVAVMVARSLGLTSRQISAGLAAFRPEAGRGAVVLREPWTVIDETYNSSPASVRACIEAMVDWSGGRRVLVLGEMLELGEGEADYHREIAAMLAHSRIDLACFVGRFAKICVEAAMRSGFSSQRMIACERLDELAAILPDVLQEGDTVCLKGSRAMQMEQLIQALQQTGNSVRAA